jgi:hypothetical protein
MSSLREETPLIPSLGSLLTDEFLRTPLVPWLIKTGINVVRSTAYAESAGILLKFR